MTRPSRSLPWWLDRSWWLVWPAFALVVVAFVSERACGDRYDLLPHVGASPVLAWMVAVCYVLGHAWLVLAYAETVRTTRMLLPHPRLARAAWGASWPKVIAALVVYVVEYTPADVWSGLAQLVDVCRVKP